MKKATSSDFSSEEILKANSLKVTRGRKNVLQILAKERRPVTIDELYKVVDGTLNITTIYRILDLFVVKGLINRTDFWGGRSYFEYQRHHHHHITCSVCGRQEEISTCVAHDLGKLARASKHFQRIDNHMIEFFGMCNKCQV